jgi:hypothetical protein
MFGASAAMKGELLRECSRVPFRSLALFEAISRFILPVHVVFRVVPDISETHYQWVRFPKNF